MPAQSVTFQTKSHNHTQYRALVKMTSLLAHPKTKHKYPTVGNVQLAPPAAVPQNWWGRGGELEAESASEAGPRTTCSSNVRLSRNTQAICAE